MKKRIILMSILIIIILFLIAGTIYFFTKVKIKIGNEELNFNILTSTKENINLTSFNAEKMYIAKNGFPKVKVNDIAIEKDYLLENIEVSRETLIKLEINYLFGIIKKTYHINTLPKDFPKYEVRGESKYEGDYYFSSYNNVMPPYYLIKINEKGKILYYKKTDQVTFDFKKIYINGNVRYSYLQTVNDDTIQVSNTSYCPTELTIMNEEYEIIDKVRFLNEDGTTQPLENHESIILGENHYILAAFKEETVDNIPETAKREISNNKITNNMIEEVKDGEILWRFQSKDYPELYEYYNDAGSMISEYKDYMHYNSASVDKKDGNLICSFRHINAILKINRKTGKLMWILGGKGDQFGLKQEQQFAKQHAVTSLDDGSILIFNNAEYDKKSTIIKLKLDEKNKKILEYNAYDIGENSIFMGSAQLLEDNPDIALICYGGVTFSKHADLEEVDLKTNERYFTFEFTNTKYMFRAYKIK